jgi:hypothetical protein
LSTHARETTPARRLRPALGASHAVVEADGLTIVIAELISIAADEHLFSSASITSTRAVGTGCA